MLSRTGHWRVLSRVCSSKIHNNPFNEICMVSVYGQNLGQNKAKYKALSPIPFLQSLPRYFHSIPWSYTESLQWLTPNFSLAVVNLTQYWMAQGSALTGSIKKHAIYLCTLLMFHSNGWCFPWRISALCGIHICLREVRGHRIWRAIADNRVTRLRGAPVVTSIIIAGAKQSKHKRDSVVEFFYSGSTVARICSSCNTCFRV